MRFAYSYSAVTVGENGCGNDCRIDKSYSGQLIATNTAELRSLFRSVIKINTEQVEKGLRFAKTKVVSRELTEILLNESDSLYIRGSIHE